MASIISCTICYVKFTNYDIILSTHCGHIYHENCFMSWKRSDNICPHCRFHNPQTHKIYLNFEESKTEASAAKLATDLEKTLKEMSQLQSKLDDSERNLLDLRHQSQNNVIEISDLQNKLDEAEKNCVALQMKLEPIENNATPSSDHQKHSSSSIVSNERIKYLEEKLKQVTVQLEKEIRNNTELCVDKMRLMVIVEHNGLNALVKDCALNTERSHEYYEKQISAKENMNMDRRYANSNLLYSLRATTVIVKGLKDKHQTQEILKQITIKLGELMDITITHNDILDIYILLSRINTIKEYKRIIIQFKTSTLKDVFVANANKLSLYPLTNHFNILEIQKQPIQSLYRCAKKLREINADVYCENEKVYMRLPKSADRIKIKDKKHVSELVEKNFPINNLYEFF